VLVAVEKDSMNAVGSLFESLKRNLAETKKEVDRLTDENQS
jgi:hypothetical protein